MGKSRGIIKQFKYIVRIGLISLSIALSGLIIEVIMGILLNLGARLNCQSRFMACRKVVDQHLMQYVHHLMLLIQHGLYPGSISRIALFGEIAKNLKQACLGNIF